MNRMILGISAVGALLFAASFSTAPVSLAMDDASFLVQEKCSVCHGLARVCTNLDKDEVWWSTTVERMALRGAEISQDQVPALATFLTNPSDDFLKLCKK